MSKDTHHINALLRLDVAKGINVINGEKLDPRIRVDDERMSPKMEGPAIDIIKSVDEHRIAHYGYAHMLPIMKALSADPKVRAVAFDTTNSKLVGFENVPDGKFKANVRAQRYYETWKMLNDPDSNAHKVVLKGKEPDSWAQAYAVAMSASLAHREKASGITDHLPKEQAEALKDVLQATLKECERMREANQGKGRN